MEPHFQTSFIPKKPIVSSQGISAPVIQTTSILSIVSTVLFVVTLLVYGSLFFYKGILNNQILAADKAVNDARSAFQTAKIQELIDVNSRLMATNNLLNQHVAVSKLLAFMQESTIKKVRFDEFTYKNDSGVLTITMSAEAQSYNALASQGDVFSKSDFIKSPYFSNFVLEDSGYIKANFSSTIDPSLVSYKQEVDSGPTNTITNTATSTATSTTQ